METMNTQTQNPSTTFRRPVTRPASTDLPTGRPTGPSITQPPAQHQGSTMAPPLLGEQPMIMENTYYVPGYLKTQIGQMLRIEFLIGSSGPMVDRIGTLLSVGASYVLIQPIGTDDTLLCDIYSIKFVTIYNDPNFLRRPI